MEISIREWERRDLKAVGKEWLGFCLNAVRSDMRVKRQPHRELSEWLDLRFRDRAGFGLIAEFEGNLAGFLLGRVDLLESVPPIVQPRKMGIIDAVYVCEHFRCRGVAGRLIERAIDKMRQRNAVAVETIFGAASESSARTWRRAGLTPWMVHAYRLL